MADLVAWEPPAPAYGLAAGGLLRSIVHDPKIEWVADRIEMLRPPVFHVETRNETRSVVRVDRATEAYKPQRQTVYLLDPVYRVIAHLELHDNEADPATLRGYEELAKRRIRRSQMWRPALLTTSCLNSASSSSGWPNAVS